MPTAADGPVHVVLAVKGLAHGKTRLADVVGAEQRRALVLAMLTDTLSAALASVEVAAAHVVTRDPEVGRVARDCGAAVIADPAREGLNPALEHAAGCLQPLPVVALQPDLPALRTGELTAALAQARSSAARCFTTDRDGTGTTMLTGFGGDLSPGFGIDSAAVHERSGAVKLTGHWPGLRCDVDSVTDLVAALRLGLGSATAAVLDRWSTPATVAEQTGDGVELRTADGAALHADQAAARLGGWRRLRPGQRVRVHRDPTGAVFLLTAPVSTLPG